MRHCSSFIFLLLSALYATVANMNSTKKCVACSGTGRVPNPIATGVQMRQRRERAGVGLRELSRKLGVSAAYLSDLELGRRGWRNLKLLKAYEAL